MLHNQSLIRVVHVGEAEKADGIGKLLNSEGNAPVQFNHVADLDRAAEVLANDQYDLLLLEIQANLRQGRAYVEAAHAAAPDVPIVILSEIEDDDLAIAALQQGVQDFLVKTELDGATLGRAMRYSIERHRLRKTLQDLSLVDDLTGLQNRRGFLALAEQHLRVIQRKGAALMIYVDLDDLKAINDTYGHLEGNRALVVTANVLRACFRQSDILARLGGDEFCVLMTDAGHDSALQVRKRLQQRVEFINALSTWQYRLSFSIGIADVAVANHPLLEDLLRIADARMYEEKRNKQARGSFSLAFKQATPA